MQTIIDEHFPAGTLPASWYTDTPAPKCSAGAWDCTTGDGVFLPLPHDAWSGLRLHVELTDITGNATAFAGTDNRTSLAIALGNRANLRHQAGDGGFIITQSATPVPVERGSLRLTFEWTADTMRVSSGDLEIIAAPNLRRSARVGSFQLGFRGCVVRRIVVEGEALPMIPAAPRTIRDDFPLEVTVDFNDDLMPTAWTRQTFTSLFTELKSWGTRRVSWIDLGREKDGYFDFAPLGIGPHGQQTFRNVGDIFTAAVETAHAHNIELYGLFKPYDMAIAGITCPPLSDIAKRCGRIARIGGSLGWATHLAADHQHLIMARKPSAHGPARQPVWTRVDLVKDDDLPAAITPDDIAIIVSDDNETFREYAGPITRREVVEEYPVYRSTPSGPIPTKQLRRSRVFRFDGLNLREPFVAIQVKGDARSFSNRLCDLVHVFGHSALGGRSGGEETHLTYGLLPRRADYQAMFMESPDSPHLPRATVGPQGGFEFNRYPGSPSAAMMSGGDPIVTPLTLDRGAVSYIALARGKDRGPLAVLSPSFPETRALWMTWITAMLDAGADGIDIRPGHHHSDFAWIEYGFEQPVRDEMLRRTGVDIWATDDFDHHLWRQVRGEGWTQFLREVSALVRGRGKKLALHIDNYFDNPPNAGGAMNIVADWRTWLEEGLADVVTGKSLWPESSMAREVLTLAHAKGVPVHYDPYCNNFFEDRRTMNHVGDSPAGCHVPVERLIEWGKHAGYDGFTFYECASALRATADGAVNFRRNAEPLREVMRRHFGGG